MTTIEELLSNKKISKDEHTVWRLFSQSDDGIKWLKDKEQELFMFAPDLSQNPPAYVFSFVDGARNVIREIKATIFKVKKLLEEVTYD